MPDRREVPDGRPATEGLDEGAPASPARFATVQEMVVGLVLGAFAVGVIGQVVTALTVSTPLALLPFMLGSRGWVGYAPLDGSFNVSIPDQVLSASSWTQSFIVVLPLIAALVLWVLPHSPGRERRCRNLALSVMVLAAVTFVATIVYVVAYLTFGAPVRFVFTTITTGVLPAILGICAFSLSAHIFRLRRSDLPPVVPAGS